jgi:hypothetical protein
MPSINTPESGHVVPGVFRASGSRKEFQFLPFTDPYQLQILRAAFSVIGGRIRGHEPCNEAFRALPGRRSFADLWADPSIWISFDPDTTPGFYGGKAIGYPPNITITAHTLAKGRLLRACLLKELFDPNIVGALGASFPGRVA